MLEALVLAAACTTTHTYTHTHSPTEQTWKWETRDKCGRNYKEWVHETRVYASGRHSVEQLYKDEYRSPHYREHEVLTTTSAKGVVTVRVTNTSA